MVFGLEFLFEQPKVNGIVSAPKPKRPIAFRLDKAFTLLLFIRDKVQVHV